MPASLLLTARYDTGEKDYKQRARNAACLHHPDGTCAVLAGEKYLKKYQSGQQKPQVGQPHQQGSQQQPPYGAPHQGAAPATAYYGQQHQHGPPPAGYPGA